MIVLDMDWFEILYYINKYSFSGIDGFNSAYEASQKLNAAKDDSRIEVIMDYLARNNMMDDAHINMMLDAMSDENRSKIDSLVDEIYKDIAAAGNFGDEKYGVALAKIIATNGSCLREDEEDEEESETSSSYEKHFLGEKTVQKFIDDVNELKKNTEHDLVSLVKFVYENNLNQVSYKNIYGDDADVCNDLQIIVPVIEGILDVESYMDDIECDFYDVILEDYSSDEAFIGAIGNIVNDFITFDSGKFDADALLNEIKTIRKNYPDEDLIAYQSVEKMLESKKVLSDNSKYVAGLFTSNKYGDYNVTLAIRHYKAYCDNDTITGKNIIDSDDVADKVKEGINNVLKFILTGYMNTINEISQKILAYDKMIATPFYINNKIKMDIIEVVNLWKNFISSNAYKYLGKSIDDEVIKKCSDLIAKNKYTIDVAGKPQPVFKKEAENIMNLIRDVNIVKPEGRYSSVLDYITTRFAKIDTPIYTQIDVMSVVVQFV